MAVEKPKYDFYENALFLDDPIQADLNRKSRTCAPKIGTEPRVGRILTLTFKFVVLPWKQRAKPRPSVHAKGQAGAQASRRLHFRLQETEWRSDESDFNSCVGGPCPLCARACGQHLAKVKCAKMDSAESWSSGGRGEKVRQAPDVRHAQWLRRATNFKEQNSIESSVRQLGAGTH